jgi:hypothetical protein
MNIYDSFIFSPRLLIPLSLDREDWNSPVDTAVFKSATKLLLARPLDTLMT